MKHANWQVERAREIMDAAGAVQIVAEPVREPRGGGLLHFVSLSSRLGNVRFPPLAGLEVSSADLRGAAFASFPRPLLSSAMLKRAFALTLVTTTLISGQVHAEQSPVRTRSGYLIQDPDWIRVPTGRDVAKSYPPAASRRRISGEAVIECATTEDGLLTDCFILSEAPGGMGFGEAAIKMSPIFKMRQTTKGGQSIAGGKVQIPFKLQVW